jgi:tetratricopeptide (TPR) repeat protein
MTHAACRHLLAAAILGTGLGFSSSAHAADCPQLRITKEVFAPNVADLAAAVRAAAGRNARPAEWNEVRACFEKSGLDYFRQMGVVTTDPANKANPPNSQILVLVNGQRYFQAPARAYFAAFHAGKLPPDWLAHDQVGGNQIALGSWSYLLPAFYVVDPPPPAPAPAVAQGGNTDIGQCTGAAASDAAIAACSSIISEGRAGDAVIAQALRRRAVAWHNKGDFERAIADYDHSLRLAPNNAAALNNRGLAWQARGNLDRAIADFADAIRADPTDQAGAYRFRSHALRQRGDIDGAIADADRSIRLFPDYNAAYVARGLAYEAKGDTARALADYRVALAMPPKYFSGPEAQRQARDRLTALERAAPSSGAASSATPAQPPPAAALPAPASPAAALPAPVIMNKFARRVALVIGNSDYKFANKLPNPVNDAEDIAALLRRLKFDVVEGKNLDRRGMDDVIRQFGRKLEGADLAVFFYAGHGLQVGGKNYLVPIDAKLERPADLALDALEVSTVLDQMEAERRVNLIFLDACRDNPLARSLARSLGTRSTSVGQGLASIQSAVGTMIAYATQPNNVALDGDGRNSPFTTALLKHITAPGLDIGLIMRRVRADVIHATRDKQVPWDDSSLVGEVILTQ